MPEATFEAFSYPLLIREHHLDTFGHVNNATYLEILEEARWEFINSRGFGMKYIQQHGIGPTILEWHIKFLKEIVLREKIIIKSQTISYHNKVGLLKQEIFNEKGELCCEAQMKFGLFDVKQRKLVSPTPEWMHAIGLITI